MRNHLWLGILSFVLSISLGIIVSSHASHLYSNQVTTKTGETLPQKGLLLNWVVSSPPPTEAYPLEVNVIDVTKKPYNALPNDDQDDTDAIQKALTDAVNHQFSTKTVYLPKGRYVVSKTLRWVDKKGEDGRHITMIGDGREKTIIQLRNNANGFQSPEQPQAVIDAAGHQHMAFGKYIKDLRIDVGFGNPGAIGLLFNANNSGAIRNVKITGNRGAVGLQLGKNNDEPGPFLVKNLYIEGFDYGIKHNNFTSTITFENLTLKDFRKAGFYQHSGASIRNLIAETAYQAPVIEGRDIYVLATVINGKVNYRGSGLSDVPAFTGEAGGYFLRNIQLSGYKHFYEGTEAKFNVSQPILKHDESGQLQKTRKTCDNPRNCYIKEYSSLGIRRGFADSNQLSLNLPVSETPYRNYPNFKDWLAVIPKGPNVNVTKELQNAMNSGKKVIYVPELPVYKDNSFLLEGNPINSLWVDDTITIPSSVEKINFFRQHITLNWNTKIYNENKPLFRIEGKKSDPPLIIENAGVIHGVPQPGKYQLGWYHTSKRTVVLISSVGIYEAAPGAGDVYFEDYVGHIKIQKGQKAWARHLDSEEVARTPEEPLVSNNGGDLWILGFKQEGAASGVHTFNGGRTELLGGVFYGGNAKAFEGKQNPTIGILSDNACISVSFRNLEGGFGTLLIEKRPDGKSKEINNLLLHKKNILQPDPVTLYITGNKQLCPR